MTKVWYLNSACPVQSILQILIHDKMKNNNILDGTF